MSKDSIWEYDVAASNTDIAGIGIEGSDAVNNFDDAFRTGMEHQQEYAKDAGGGGLTAGGTADALTLTPNQTIASYVDGMHFSFKVASDNATTSPTLAVGTGGAEPIKKGVVGVETALAAGDLKAGDYVTVYWRSAWDSGGGAWQVVSHSQVNRSDFGDVIVHQRLHDIDNTAYNAGTVGTYVNGNYAVNIGSSGNFTPTNANTKLHVECNATIYITQAGGAGADMGARMYLGHYNGTAYVNSGAQALFIHANFDGTGTMQPYSRVTLTSVLTQSELRSDTSQWLPRMRFTTVYTNNVANMNAANFTITEYEEL